MEAIQRRLINGEKLLDYLDDVTVICSPERVRAVLTIIGEEFDRHAQPPKFNEKTPREGRKERILWREREKKERNFGRSGGRSREGRSREGRFREGRSREGRSREGRSREGRSGNRETNTHTQKHTHKHTHTNTHKHTQTHTHKHTQTHTNTSRSRFGQSRFWPKSVLAKVGHSTKTLTLAKVGLAKVGHQLALAKLGWPKSVWPKSAMTHPSMLALVVDVCCNQGEFLVPRCLRTHRVMMTTCGGA